MKFNTTKSTSGTSSKRGMLKAALALLAAPIFTAPAMAVELNPVLQGEGYCMQKAFGTPVTGKNALNCTANDIRLARVLESETDFCVEGAEFELKNAKFAIAVNASIRYDAAFFFSQDGTNARGQGINATGSCAVLTAVPGSTPFEQLDGDNVGDIRQGSYEAIWSVPGIMCADTDNDGFVNLPNCTSWHNGASVPAAFDNLASLAPETKSKCACDDTFNIPVRVEKAGIRVTKTATEDTVAEPGGYVTFNVKIENTGNVPVTISSISDDKYGDLLSASLPNVRTNSCTALANFVLEGISTADYEVDCAFEGLVEGDKGFSHLNKVTVSTVEGVSDDDTALVLVVDAQDDPSISKTALSTANCTVEARYQVTVTNNSTADTLTIDSFIDNRFGDVSSDPVNGLGSASTCDLGTEVPVKSTAPMAPSNVYTCTFAAVYMDADCAGDHVNTVGVTTTDSDNYETTITSDEATVSISVTP